MQIISDCLIEKKSISNQMLTGKHEATENWLVTKFTPITYRINNDNSDTDEKIIKIWIWWFIF